jgi:hypothetical protein
MKEFIHDMELNGKKNLHLKKIDPSQCFKDLDLDLRWIYVGT